MIEEAPFVAGVVSALVAVGLAEFVSPVVFWVVDWFRKRKGK